MIPLIVCYYFFLLFVIRHLCLYCLFYVYPYSLSITLFFLCPSHLFLHSYLQIYTHLRPVPFLSLSYYIISYYILSCYIISYYIISYYILSCYIIFYYILSYYILSYLTLSYPISFLILLLILFFPNFFPSLSLSLTFFFYWSISFSYSSLSISSYLSLPPSSASLYCIDLTILFLSLSFRSYRSTL